MAKRGLPPNLYERRGYYSWRNPQTREEYGLGTNKVSAIHQAIEANMHIAKVAGPSLLDRLTGNADRSVAAWAAIYQKKIDGQEFADNTRRHYASLNRRMVTALGADTPMKNVTALIVSRALDVVAVTEGKARLAQALRHFMRDSFREAIVEGWRDDNPVRETKLSAPVKVKRARLTFDLLMQIYERTDGWLRNAIALAIVSGQRREDISRAMFGDFKKGGWWCVQESEKSTHPHRLYIPLELRLNVFKMSLGDVVSQCRRSGIATPYLIHQTERRGNSPVGSQIWLDTISKRFSAVVESLGIDWGDRTPPTFHELRSLSKRLYDEQGGVITQHLLGHNDESTTALYGDGRGVLEWTHALDGRKIVSE